MAHGNIFVSMAGMSLLEELCVGSWDTYQPPLMVHNLKCRSKYFQLMTNFTVTTYRAELDMIKHSNILKNVTCSGTESHLTSCCAIETGSLYCSSQAYAGVRCEDFQFNVRIYYVATQCLQVVNVQRRVFA